MMRKYRVWLLGGLLSLILTGCTMFSSVEDLYALPRLSDEYQDLGEQISAILAEGAEYAAPQSGTNLQPVQLVDLDGDGLEEAVAFFRTSSGDHPLKVYIFRSVDDTYELVSVIEGTGSSFHSVRYVDLDGGGTKEMLISWRISAEVQALSVYALEDFFHPVQLMSSAYARYEALDLDGDKERELVVLRGNETEPGGIVADYYDWDGGSLLQTSSVRLSMSLSELQWMQIGTLQSGEPAIFVTGRVTGVEETSRSITDILIFRSPELVNIVQSSATGVSSEVFRFLSLQPADINGDGSTEVPMPAELPSVVEGESYWKIYWRSYSSDGKAQRQAITYHNLTDSWYFVIPDKWDGHFTARQINSSNTEHATTFYRVDNFGEMEELFTIYTLTGPRRETQGQTGGREILVRQTNRIYAVRFTEAYGDWRYAVDRAAFDQCFHRIIPQWSSTET